MPPVRRGDLYRDYLLGFRVFVIVDGVFFQDLAVSPREIVDVLEDGGIVVGASSMGAMRAAECWPAGARGVGSIYRLFRRGILKSDDEVAVAFSPLPPYSPATVPLVNVRYAVSRAIRDGNLSRSDAARLVDSASELHYCDRTWDSIRQRARISTRRSRVFSALEQHDLKRLDAIRALRRVRRWITEYPDILHHSGPSLSLVS